MNTIDKKNLTGICAVVTTFRPDDNFLDRISRIQGQVRVVIIVDDGATEENKVRLTGWFGGLPGVVLLRHPSNLGVAAALNTGIEQAGIMGFTHVLLLDEDSLIATGMVDALMAALENETTRLPAIVGTWCNCRGKQQADVTAARIKEVSTIITAGSLVPLKVFDMVGPFREDLFIDYVDHEYCLRARSLGVRILQSREACMQQPVGHAQKTLLGELRSVHSESRTYYFFRNSLIVAREYAFRFPGFSAWIGWQQIKTVVKIVLFMRPKRQYFRAMLRGWSDGWSRRTGRITDGVLP